MAACVVLGAAAAVPAAAPAHDELISSDGGVSPGYEERHLHQHGGNTGQLPATSSNVDLVSKLRLKNVEPEKIADVGVSQDGDTAFLAAWGGATCNHMVDIADPAKPRETAFIQSKEGSYPGKGVQALNLTTSAFKGQILVTNNEICKDRADFGGMNIYDVTRPSGPDAAGRGRR